MGIIINGIRSNRGLMRAACYDVVYEWEDSISELLSIPIKRVAWLDYGLWSKLTYLRGKYTVRYQDLRKAFALCFITSVRELRYVYRRNIIPVFLDVWGKSEIQFIVDKMSGGYFFVTSVDVYNRVQALSPTSHVMYCPLSVADKWLRFDPCPKTIDSVQIGRRNPVIHDFMLRYVAARPGFEYIYSTSGTSLGSLNYTSTTRGGIGAIRDRNSYIQLLRSSRISLVSSPGIDGSRHDADGIDFPTPRFYESAAAGCHLIGRYGSSGEFRQLGIDRVCFNARSFETFEAHVDMCRGADVDMQERQKFVHRHLTSTRVQEMIATIDTTACT